MPYGYYQLIRFVAMTIFCIMAYYYYGCKQEILGIIFVVLAVLFQPFFKIALGRMLWNIVDVVIAFFLIVLCIIEVFQTKNHGKE
jgi:hypothetical protein